MGANPSIHDTNACMSTSVSNNTTLRKRLVSKTPMQKWRARVAKCDRHLLAGVSAQELARRLSIFRQWSKYRASLRRVNLQTRKCENCLADMWVGVTSMVPLLRPLQTLLFDTGTLCHTCPPLCGCPSTQTGRMDASRLFRCDLCTKKQCQTHNYRRRSRICVSCQTAVKQAFYDKNNSHKDKRSQSAPGVVPILTTAALNVNVTGAVVQRQVTDIDITHDDKDNGSKAKFAVVQLTSLGKSTVLPTYGMIRAQIAANYITTQSGEREMPTYGNIRARLGADRQ